MSKYLDMAEQWLSISHDHRNHPIVTELARDTISLLREAAELERIVTATASERGKLRDRIAELEAVLRAYMAMTDAPPAIEAKARAALDKREVE